VAGGILFGMAGVLVVFAAARAFGRVRRRRPDTARSLSPATVLGGCLRALGDVKDEAARGGGWSPERARAALAALRIAGAVGIGRPVAQTPASRDTQAREGQIKVRHGRLRPRWAIVSGAATAPAIERELAHGSVALPAATRAMVERLGAALRTFASAAYSRDGQADSTALDAALGEAVDAARYLRRRNLWPAGGAAVERQAGSALPAPSMSGERL
jgi:hypothetical protein